MSVTLYAENYRALRKVKWELPKGVCALVGPNGSGKTTLLKVPELLARILAEDVRKAIDRVCTTDALRNFNASSTDPVLVGIGLDNVKWQIRLRVREGFAYPPYAYEEEFSDSSDKVERSSNDIDTSYMFNGKRYQEHESAFLSVAIGKYRAPLVMLAGYRIYESYNMELVRGGLSKESGDRALGLNGTNVLTILRNWRDRRETEPRYRFVIESLKNAFPDIFEDLEFIPSDAGVSGRIVLPGNSKPVAMSYAPNGWLTMLLHLCAVASTVSGGIVAIDEPENGLHPFGIKQLVGAAREWADEQDITILLATHSPVLLDQFKTDPDHLFVMDPGHEVLPVRLDQVRDPGWLAQFSLGDLYKYGDFGAPAEGAHVGA